MTAAATQLRPVPLADKYEEGPARELDAIAADLGKVMADTVFAGVEGLSSDWKRHCEKYQLGSSK